jgi:hypothetical protein
MPEGNGYQPIMPAKSHSPSHRQPPPILATGAEGAMTPEQAAELKQVALEAYELDAFKQQLTARDAARRIAMLKAKLKLLDGPPHTL